MPNRPTKRASYTPGGTLGAMLTVNLFASLFGLPVIPLNEKCSRSGSSRSDPARVTSRVAPAWPPGGKM
jgi:hypothetical protein